MPPAAQNLLRFRCLCHHLPAQQYDPHTGCKGQPTPRQETEQEDGVRGRVCMQIQLYHQGQILHSHIPGTEESPCIRNTHQSSLEADGARKLIWLELGRKRSGQDGVTCRCMPEDGRIHL
ncbi:uncharacterized protein BDCG_03625 [Blastomyces dermatitidis ER-3]|uniref:Uncharacterized protein n=3 Tax=Blastomyces TaxID=229219 RepID=A0A179UE71_BLAGS|nr:uncharacterized protein BDBG_01938 [Blastomyces gilchristii SLH14081]XP_045275621.1 uncharacterized protein BDCG_03625 [Blastomyces dermatitidis ER-3]EGE77326.1 hypothetical protein BDDG_00263 [Blastomyces dermatitidis ATCC 18188]EQL38586.1 hypothetical protein BDFG_00155 [Blastomyces dermatitidis ATCC 26199]EEQ88505.2 hypothetical protein BDCG_03625 [Blastomyces dermatitidis ER-3]OAT05558.1 hypothetical protein BDBG_01938 [Blastomyces gilchristii SLH14081]